MPIKWIILLVFCCSCQKASRWTYTAIRSGNKDFDTKCICYTAKDPINEPELEITMFANRVYLYLNLFHPNLSNHRFSKVHISTSEEQIDFDAIRLRGGGKLVIKEPYSKWILDKILSKQSLIITVEGFKVAVEPNGFKQYYEKSKKKQNLPNKLVDLAL